VPTTTAAHAPPGRETFFRRAAPVPVTSILVAAATSGAHQATLGRPSPVVEIAIVVVAVTLPPSAAEPSRRRGRHRRRRCNTASRSQPHVRRRFRHRRPTQGHERRRAVPVVAIAPVEVASLCRGTCNSAAAAEGRHCAAAAPGTRRPAEMLAPLPRRRPPTAREFLPVLTVVRRSKNFAYTVRHCQQLPPVPPRPTADGDPPTPTPDPPAATGSRRYRRCHRSTARQWRRVRFVRADRAVARDQRHGAAEAAGVAAPPIATNRASAAPDAASSAAMDPPPLPPPPPTLAGARSVCPSSRYRQRYRRNSPPAPPAPPFTDPQRDRSAHQQRR
jgi:hypothetical protein